ncbi:MAG: FkbM family methyltransferase [Ignavibacteria bacterium]
MNEELQMRNVACQALASGLKPKAVLLDVGAMGGPMGAQFRYLCERNLITYVGLEPQEDECAKLRTRFPDGIFLPVAVGDSEGTFPLHLTVSPACISILKPNKDVVGKYPISTCFELTGTSSVALTTIEKLVGEGRIPSPDYIKCDAQGFDYQVLKGCGSVLDTVIGIEVECQFKQIYERQRTFFEVKQLLESHGFILRDMQHQGAFEYEVVEVNAFFSKRPHEIGDKLQSLKLWEFASGIKSPSSFAQLKRSNPASDIFGRVTPEMDRTVLFE